MRLRHQHMTSVPAVGGLLPGYHGDCPVTMVTDNFPSDERLRPGKQTAPRQREERRLSGEPATTRHISHSSQKEYGGDYHGLKMRGPVPWARAALFLALLTALGTSAVNHLNGAKIKTVDGNVVFMAARRGGDIKFKDTHTAIFGNMTIQQVMDWRDPKSGFKTVILAAAALPALILAAVFRLTKEQTGKLDKMLAEANRVKREVPSSLFRPPSRLKCSEIQTCILMFSQARAVKEKYDKVMGQKGAGRERRAAEDAQPENAAGDGEADSPPPYPTRTADNPDPTARPVPREVPPPLPDRSDPLAEPARKSRSLLGVPEPGPDPDHPHGHPWVYPDYPYPEDIPDDYYSDRLPNDYSDRVPNNPDSFRNDPESLPNDPDPLPNYYDRLPNNPNSLTNDPDRLPNYLDPLPKDPDSFPNDPDSLSTYSDSLLDDLYPDVYYMGPDYDEYGTDDPDSDNQTDPYGNNMYPGDPPHAEYSALDPLDRDPVDPKWSPYPEHEPHPLSDGSDEFSAQQKLDWDPPADPEPDQFPGLESYPEPESWDPPAKVYPYPDPEQAPHSPNEGSGGVPFPETEYPPRRFPDDPAGDPLVHPEPAWDSPPVDPEPESFPEWESHPEPEEWAPPADPEPGRFRRHARPEPEWEPNPDPEAWDPPVYPEWDPEPRPESSEEWADPEPEWEPRPGSSSGEEWAQPEQEPRPESSNEWDPPVDYDPEVFPESRPESEEWDPPVDPESEWYPEQEPQPESESEWENRPGSDEWASPVDPEPEWYPESEERDPLADPEREVFPEQEPQPESEELEPRPGSEEDFAQPVDRPTGKYPRSLPGSRPYIGETDQRPLLEHPDWVPMRESEPFSPSGQLPGNPANPPIEPYNPHMAMEPYNPANPPMEPANPANPPMEANNPANPPIEPGNPANPPMETNNPANPPMANNNTDRMTDSDFVRAKRSLHGNAKHRAHRLADFPPNGNPKPHPHADPPSGVPNSGRDGPKAERDGLAHERDGPSVRDGPPGEEDPAPLKRKRHGKTSRARGDKPAHMAAKLY
ncbi:hypothetical protein Bbelb_007360 [Branchiostoma belcheri]|nr:hypothetical protein Bbelb_007360 [Branchiostoma belcheri]